VTGGVDETISEVCRELLGQHVSDGGIDGFGTDNAGCQGEAEDCEFYDYRDGSHCNCGRYAWHNANSEHNFCPSDSRNSCDDDNPDTERSAVLEEDLAKGRLSAQISN
jgi:hypothetical protein